MRRFIERRTAGILFFALAFASCSRDHDALALKSRGGAGGAAGSAGTSGAGKGGTSGTTGGSAGTSGTGGVPPRPMEPVGRSVTTVLHGIVDAGRTLFCFARAAGRELELVGDPLPQGGLAYASSFSFESLDAIELESEGVVPFAISGELDLIAGLDCEAAVRRAEQEMAAVSPPSGAGGAGGEGGGAGEAGSGGPAEPPVPPRLRVAALSELPAPALAEGYSTLVVATGCLGGAAFTHSLDEAACGDGYGPGTPTAGALFVLLPRSTQPGKLTLYGFHASRAAGRLSVVAAPPSSSLGVSITIAPDLRFGALLPRLPFSQLEPGDYGVDTAVWSAQASRDGTLLISEFWFELVRRAELDAVEAGRAYSVVVLGPDSEAGEGGFWNPPALAVVDHDPTP